MEQTNRVDSNENEYDTPENGWYPDEAIAPITQMLFKNGKPVANIIRIKIQGAYRWRSYSLLELNESGTGGKPLSDSSVATREEAKQQAEDYASKL